MPIPEFIVDLRRRIGHDPLWLMAATGVVLREIEGVEHVLLVKRSDDGCWAVTAGVVEPGEEPALTAEREVIEETGVSCRADRLGWVFVEPPTTHSNGDQAQYLELIYTCTWMSGEPTPADDESTDARWWPVVSLPPLHPIQRARISAARADGHCWMGLEDGMRKAGEQ